MFSRWAIRHKLTLCLAMLIAIVGALSFSSFQGVYSYRRLARSISTRAKELPLAEAINQNSDDLQTMLNIHRNDDVPLTTKAVTEFHNQLDLIEFSTHQYNLQLSTSQQEGEIIGNIHQEQELIRDVNQQVQLIRQQIRRAKSGNASDSYAVIGVALGHVTGPDLLVRRAVTVSIAVEVEVVRSPVTIGVCLLGRATVRARSPDAQGEFTLVEVVGHTIVVVIEF